MTRSKKEQAKYTLITNIQFFQRINPVRDNLRINCHALLFSEGEFGIMSKVWTLRGFGTEAAWGVFQLWLDKDTHFPFTLVPVEDHSSVILHNDGNVKPIFSGTMLT